MLSGADTETDGRWDIVGVLMYTVEEFGEGFIEGIGGACDTHAGDDVDERICNLAEEFHA